MGIADYSTDPGANASQGFAEGQLPGTLNDSMRSVLANTREAYNDASWIDYRDGTPDGTYTRVSGTSFKVTGGGSVVAKYAENVRVRAIGATTGTIYGTITGSSYSAPDTTVVVDWNSGSLANEALSICISVVEPNASPGGSADFSNGASGYYTLPGGIIMQWGVDTTVTSGRTVSFPTTFPNACWGVYPSLRFASSSGLTFVTVDYSNLTTTGFKQVVLDHNTPDVVDYDVTSADYTYFAIGN